MKKCCIFLSLLLLLLAGCGKPVAPTEPPVTLAPTDAAMEPSTEPSTEPVDATEYTPEMAAMYEEYFSAIDPVPLVRQDGAGGYSLIPEFTEDVVTDGTELKAKYEKRTYFTDPYGHIQFNGYSWHGCVFFSASDYDVSTNTYSENYDAIYRLYLPTGTVDKLVAKLAVTPGMTYIGQILSNWEVEYEYAGFLMCTNNFTGENKYIRPAEDGWVYPDGSIRPPEEEQENGYCWWLDSYYTSAEPSPYTVELRKNLVSADGQILYTDPYGRMDWLPGVWDDHVLFLAGVDDTHDGIYRLDRQTGEISLVTGDIPLVDGRRHTMFLPDWNVRWTVWDPEFYIACEKAWDQEFTGSDGNAIIPREAWGNGRDFEPLLVCDPAFFAQVTEDNHFDKPYITEYYLDGPADRLLTIYSYATQSEKFYPDGTQRPDYAQTKNGIAWWLDDYYQTNTLS